MPAPAAPSTFNRKFRRAVAKQEAKRIERQLKSYVPPKPAVSTEDINTLLDQELPLE